MVEGLHGEKPSALKRMNAKNTPTEKKTLKGTVVRHMRIFPIGQAKLSIRLRRDGDPFRC